MRRLIPLLALLAVFAMATRISVDPDTWWHLRAGQWMVENRSILRADPFSYTRLGASWQYPGWIVQIPMYWIYRAGGPGGLNLWTGAMVALAFLFIWKTLSGNVFLRAFATIFAATASGVYWAARPYLVTFVLAAVFLWLLEEDRKGQADSIRIVWALPVLMVLWANSHGGFAVGFLLWGVYLAGSLVSSIQRNSRLLFLSPKGAFVSEVLQDSRRHLLAGVLMLAAACLNPSGPVMLAYPFKTVGIGALQEYIAEWQSPDFQALNVQPFVALLLVTFGVVGASRKRLELSDFLLFAVFAYMALMAGRNIALFALVAPMVLTRHLAPLLDSIWRFAGVRMTLDLDSRRRNNLLMNSVLLVLLGLAVILKAAVLVLPDRINREYFAETLPVEAAAFLKAEQPSGRLFNPYNWGGYLVWALPEYPVFVDGRTDLYDDEIIDQWLAVTRMDDGWQEIVEAYGIQLILAEYGSDFETTLSIQPGWKRLHQDSVAVVYQRAAARTYDP